MERSHESYECRLALQGELQDAYHRTAVDTVRLLGFDLPAWDSQDFLNLPLESREAERFGFHTIRFSDHPLQPCDVLKQPYFKLFDSSISLRAANQIDIPDVDSRSGYLLDLIDTPSKEIGIRLFSAAGTKTGSATIYVMSDSPPFAIHDDDIAYIRQYRIAHNTDLSDIQAFTHLFGEDSISYLSEDMCATLILALRSVPNYMPSYF